MLKCKCGLAFKNKGALKQHEKFCSLSKEIINAIRKDYLINLMSLNDLYKKYNDISSSMIRRVLNNMLRNHGDARKAASVTKPEKLKHSDKTKEKIRIKRLKYMKENPDKTAWRSKNMSYPEKVFNDQLKKLNLHKKYLIVREFSMFPYFIDFAFVNEKIAVEIDGSQHLISGAKERDLKKENLLKEKGWRIIRITANKIKNDTENSMKKVLFFLDSDNKFEKVGLLEYEQYKKDVLDKEIREKKKIKAKEKQDKIDLIKQKLIESDIDFSKFGWVEKASKIIGITAQNVNRWMKRNMCDFYAEKCFKRK
jgi:very-short-patch-repair endonuclease